MAKNNIFIYLILTTYILLVAFSLLPHHHHHDTNICMAEAHCHTNDDQHKEKNHEHESHKHDAKGKEHCIFDYVVILPSTLKKAECKIHVHNSLQQILSYKNRTKFSKDQEIKQFFKYNNNHLLFSRKLTETLLSSSKGLRAPPIV